jgi:hypothetical protein
MIITGALFIAVFESTDAASLAQNCLAAYTTGAGFTRGFSLYSS